MRREWLLAMVIGAVATGCDYVVPLAGTPRMDLDSRIVGAWERKGDNDQVERLLVLPLSQREYMVAFPAGVKNTLYAKAWLCKGGGKTLVQLQWFGTGEGKVPDDKRVYQCAAYEVDGDRLTVRMVSTEVVNRDLATSADLAGAVEANQEKPTLFGDPMVFQKAAP
jgi:hypothetical protein